MSPQLITDWSTDDPKVAETLRLIASYPQYSVERQEMEAALHLLQARWCWREADRLRQQAEDRKQRRAARARSSDAPA